MGSVAFNEQKIGGGDGFLMGFGQFSGEKRTAVN
jgi:hypothetical protein